MLSLRTNWLSKVLLMSVCMVSVAATNAADYVTYKTRITEILTDSTSFGGCMIRVASGPQSQGLAACNDAYVALDCDGNYSTKSHAQSKLSAAQLAFVMNRQVKIRVTDGQLYNSKFCLVERIDNL